MGCYMPAISNNMKASLGEKNSPLSLELHVYVYRREGTGELLEAEVARILKHKH